MIRKVSVGAGPWGAEVVQQDFEYQTSGGATAFSGSCSFDASGQSVAFAEFGESSAFACTITPAGGEAWKLHLARVGDGRSAQLNGKVSLLIDLVTGQFEVLLSGGLDSSLVVGLLAEAGQHDLKTFSIGFEAAGGEQGDEFKYSDVIAQHFATDHHRIRIDTDRLLPALGDAVGAMSEPMVSHDVVAFYLLSQEVSRHVKVVQSGQGADEVFAGYHWYPPMTTAPGLGVDTYAAAFFDRTHDEMAEVVQPEHLLEEDVSRAFVKRHFERPGAETAVDRALRLDSRRLH